MIGSDRGVTVGRGRIRLRSSHRSNRITLHVSHRRFGAQAPSLGGLGGLGGFGRRDDPEDEIRRKPHGNRGKKKLRQRF
jgi:hypothetical protein